MSVSQAELKVFISAHDQASAGIRGVSGALSQLGGAVKGGGAGFLSLSSAMAAGTIASRAIIGAVQGIGSAIGGTVSQAAGFESSLNNFQAVSGASADQMARAATQAKALGADMTLPATSAADAAKAMTELVRAGIDVDEALDATRGTLQLAAAAQIDEAKAAAITAAALNTFGLEGKEAGRVADELATAANASAADITDLAAGMQQAGFIFKATGRPIEELISSLALLTNAGLTGSDAGTALKNAFMRMIDPTKEAKGEMNRLGISFFDAQGNLKPLPSIVDHLNDRLGGLTQQERANVLTTLLLSDGFKAMNPLLDQGGEKLRALEGKLKKQGSAADLAAAKTKGLQGAFDGFNSQVETLQITLGQKFGPTLERVTRFAADGVGAINSAVEGIDVSAVFGGMQTSLNNASAGFYAFGQNVSTFGDNLKLIPGIGQFANRELNILGSVATGVAAILRGDAAGAVAAFGNAASQAGEGFAELAAFVDGKVKAILGFVGGLVGIKFGPDATSEEMWNRLAQVAGEKLAEIGAKFDALGGELSKLRLGDDVQLSFRNLGDSAKIAGQGIKDVASAVDGLNQNVKSVTGLGLVALALKGISLWAVAATSSLGNILGALSTIASAGGAVAQGMLKHFQAVAAFLSGDIFGAANLEKQAVAELDKVRGIFERADQDLVARNKAAGIALQDALDPARRASRDLADSLDQDQKEIAAGWLHTKAASAAMVAGFDKDNADIAAGWAQARAASASMVAGFDQDQADIAAGWAESKAAGAAAAEEFDRNSTVVAGSFGATVAAAEDGMSTIVATLQSGAAESAAAVQSGMDEIPPVVDAGMAAAAEAVDRSGTEIATSAETAFTGIATSAEASMPAVVTATETGMQGAQTAVTTAAPAMQAAMTTATAGMVAETGVAMSAIDAETAAGMSRVPATISAQAGPAAGAAASVGSAMVAGLQGALLSGLNVVAAAAAALVTGAINAARAAADARSPSKKTEKLGEDMWAGLNNALAAGKLDQSIVDAIRDYADAARSYLPVATEIARVEEEIGRVRQRAQVDGLFRELQMIDATSHLLMLKRDLAQAEADLLPNRQALAAAEREVRGIEQGSLAQRQQGLEIDKERAELRLKQIDLEKQLIGLPRDSKQAKAIQAELDALRDKDRALQLEADRIRITNQIAAADAKQRRELAAEAVQQGEAAEQGTRDQIAAIEALAAVFAANEAIIKNRTDNEVKQWERVKAVFEAQGAPIQERIKAGLALIDQLEAEGSISKELADKLRAVAQQAAGSAKATATAVQQQAAAVKEASAASRSVNFESGGTGDVLKIDPKATVEAVERTAAEAQAALNAANLTLPPLVVDPETVVVPETVVSAMDLVQTELDGLSLVAPPVDPETFNASIAELIAAAEASLSESEGQVDETLAAFGSSVEASIGKMTGTGASGGDEVGTAIWKGMREGVLDGKGPLAEAVKKIVEAALEAARGAAQIASPSRKFREIGRQSAEGLRQGLLDSQAAVMRAGNQMMASAIPTVSREAESHAVSGGQPDGGDIHVHLSIDGRDLEHSLTVWRDRAIRSGAR